MLAAFVPRYAVRACPGGDGLVAREGPAIAGFFVGPQRGDAVGAADIFEHCNGVAGADDQRLAEMGERGVEFGEALANELELAPGQVGLLPETRLLDVEG